MWWATETGKNEWKRGAHGHRWQHLPSQGHPQGHLAVPWPYHSKPDRPGELWAKFRRSLPDVRVREVQTRHRTSICWWSLSSSTWSDAQYRRTPEHATTWIIWRTEEQQTGFAPASQAGSRPFKNCMRATVQTKTQIGNMPSRYRRTCEEAVGRKTARLKMWITPTTLL